MFCSIGATRYIEQKDKEMVANAKDAWSKVRDAVFMGGYAKGMQDAVDAQLERERSAMACISHDRSKEP